MSPVPVPPKQLPVAQTKLMKLPNQNKKKKQQVMTPLPIQLRWALTQHRLKERTLCQILSPLLPQWGLPCH